MSSLRCSDCGISWPNAKQWTLCGKCLAPTDPVPETCDWDMHESRRQTLHFEFLREYARREKGLENKCGPRRPGTAKQRERLQQLWDQGQFVNEWTRTYRSSQEKGDS